MNNNNRGNNRRRGRGNNNRQQGGGQPLNRIDSRARGNAPQLLEKYRKLAHDAHLNGDRVTEEYYLQFADHYFRVLADSRQRQEEARARREDRWEGGGDPYRDDPYRDGEDGGEYGDGDYDAPPQVAPRREREDRPRSDDREGRGGRAPRVAPAPDRAEPAVDAAEPAEQQAIFEPAENPFTRDARPGRGLRPRRESAEREAPREERRPRRTRRAEPAQEAEATLPGLDSAGLDPATLPPAISASKAEAAPEAAEEAPKPRKRVTRKPKAAAADAGEALTAAESK